MGEAGTTSVRHFSLIHNSWKDSSKTYYDGGMLSMPTTNTKVVINVMLKAEILDPQGQAIANALPRMGFSLNPVSTRQGKRFEFTFDHAPTEVEIAEIKKAAETLLANPVIETFEIRMEH